MLTVAVAGSPDTTEGLAGEGRFRLTVKFSVPSITSSTTRGILMHCLSLACVPKVAE